MIFNEKEQSSFRELSRSELANIEGGVRRGGRRTGSVTNNYNISFFDGWHLRF